MRHRSNASDYDPAPWPTERSAPELAREYDRTGISNDFATSVRIVNWAYTQTFECRGLTWVESDRLEPLPPGWEQPLREAFSHARPVAASHTLFPASPQSS